MLSHLITSSNEITVYRQLKDRDGDVTSEFEVGTAYGIFRTSLKEEFAMGNKLNYTWVGILTHYSSSAIQDVDTAYTPKQGDVCEWKGKRYYIEGVHERFDLDGNFVGYWIGATDRVR
ncbi:MAG TPA: hypothetical protein PK525_11210 [Anaerohalosphaeraceae bacterium]|jgi:hypothetical protein|nr:hypothetical protein [Anaerohalosphaeraceae bacterium]